MAGKRINGSALLQLALGLYLLVLGIQGFTSYNSSSAELGRFFGKAFGSNGAANIIAIGIAILQVLSGAFLLIEFFVKLGKITDLVIFSLVIVWIVYIAYTNVYVAFVAQDFSFKPNFIIWLKELSLNLLVLAGILFVYLYKRKAYSPAFGLHLS